MPPRSKAENTIETDLDWEGGAGILGGGTLLATRRPATEQSEGASLGAPPELTVADEEDTRADRPRNDLDRAAI